MQLNAFAFLLLGSAYRLGYPTPYLTTLVWSDDQLDGVMCEAGRNSLLASLTNRDGHKNVNPAKTHSTHVNF